MLVSISYCPEIKIPTSFFPKTRGPPLSDCNEVYKHKFCYNVRQLAIFDHIFTEHTPPQDFGTAQRLLASIDG